MRGTHTIRVQSCVVRVLHLVVTPEDACIHQLPFSVLCEEATTGIMTLRMSPDMVFLTHPSSTQFHTTETPLGTLELCLWVTT